MIDPQVLLLADIQRDVNIARMPTEIRIAYYMNNPDECVSPKSPRSPYVIAATTLVMVTNKSRKLITHRLTKSHFFMTYLVGNTPEIVMSGPKGDDTVYTNPAELLKSGYYVFETGNPAWPHMIVPRESIRTEEVQSVSTDMMNYDEPPLMEDTT